MKLYTLARRLRETALVLVWGGLVALGACSGRNAAGRLGDSTLRESAQAPATVPRVREAPKRNASGLYSAEEALQDLLSGELRYIGTGPWPGIERSRACVFRNQRVLVVNAYCSLNEPPAFRVDVYSPTRGRLRIYAEARGPVSGRDRRTYFTFMASSQPPLPPEMRIGPLRLGMSYDEIRRYERRRGAAELPGCYGGEQLERAVGGCLGSLAPLEDQWLRENHDFLSRPNGDWYRTVRMLRGFATQYGQHPR